MSRTVNLFFDKDLDAALDSDNLFCWRCLVFDCRLHGCSQDLVFLAEKQHLWIFKDAENVPCGLHCYRLVMKSEDVATGCPPMCVNLEDKPVSSSDGTGPQILARKKSAIPSVSGAKSSQSGSASSNARNASDSSDSEIKPGEDSTSIHDSPSSLKTGKDGICKRNSKRIAECVLACGKKRQKNTMASDSDSIVSDVIWPWDAKVKSDSRQENQDV